MLGQTQSDEETIGDEFNVLAHELGVHANEGDGQGFGQEFLLQSDCVGDDVSNAVGRGGMAKVGEEQAGKVGVEAFVSGDQLVAEGEAGHQATLLEPEDGGERAREEDTLDGGKGNKTFSERVVGGDPLESPVSLLLDARDYGSELGL